MLEKLEPDSERYGQRIPTLGGEPVSGIFLEMTYDPIEARTGFAVWDGSSVTYLPRFPVGGNRFWVPFSPANNLIVHQVILLPSKAEEYLSEEALLGDIQAFIHRYVDVSPVFEKIATYYVLFTWVYDCFNDLPYLRLRGDPGTGKTRFLLIVGSICYRPIFASGASTVSPLFRLLDLFRGTLLIDEGDFRYSDEKAEIVKILNNGNARGFPVLRSEVTGNRKEYDPRAYSVFGPKLVGTRGSFDDKALESRFITEEMGQGPLRADVPINLPFSYKEEALGLRNKLLMFRFRNRDRRKADETLVDREIEPRLNQIFVPLLSIVKNGKDREEIRNLARQYSREMVADRSLDVEAQVLETIRDLAASTGKAQIPIKEITRLFTERHGQEIERPITAKWIGTIIRRRLHLATQKSHGVFVLNVPDPSGFDLLCRKYGVAETAEVTSEARQGT